MRFKFPPSPNSLASRFALAAALAWAVGAGTPARAASDIGYLERAEDANLILVELTLDRTSLSDAVAVYEVRNDVLLPLGEMARLLTMGITVNPISRGAEGFVAEESKTFELDPALRKIAYAGKSITFDERQVRWIDGELYVAKGLLQQVLPVDFALDMATQKLEAVPREKLPIQLKLERERQAKLLGQGGVVEAGRDYPRLPNDYSLITAPFIDSTISGEVRKAGSGYTTNAAYSGAIAGDLLGMEATGFFSISKADGAIKGRFTLGRHNPEPVLLGPLKARTLELGDVTLPAVRNLLGGGGGGAGYLVSNRPLNLGSSYGLETLRGSLPPGWDVSLYINDALVAFQTSRPDGTYEFKDLNLVFGRTEFRLAFNGPLGQHRVERRVFQLDQSLTAPGELYYSLGGKREKGGALRQVGQFDYGLTRNVAVTASFVLLDRPGAGSHQFVATGVRAALGGALLNVDYTRALAGRDTLDVGLRTSIAGLAIDASRRWGSDLGPDAVVGNETVRVTDRLVLNGSIAFGKSLRLPIALEGKRETYASGQSSLTVNQRLSLNVAQASVTNLIGWEHRGGSDLVDGSLQIGRRVAGAGLNAQLGYKLAPKALLANIALGVDKMLNETNRLNFGVIRNFSGGDTTFSAGVNRRFGDFAVGVSGFYGNPRNFGVGLTLFTAIGHNGGGGRLIRDWQPLAGSGLVSARAFVDANNNHRFDPGEEPIRGATFAINGSNRSEITTDRTGHALINRLPTRAYTSVALDPTSLEDVQWQPGTAGVRVLPRPGKALQVDFPVVTTAEVDGTVTYSEGTMSRGIGNALIEVVDETGQVTASARSTGEGYYVISGVRPGRYKIRISPSQLAKLKVRSTAEADLVIGSDGQFLYEQNFSLSSQ